MTCGSFLFRRVYGYRPGFIKPYKGQKKAHASTATSTGFPLGRKLSPDHFNTMEELALSMIRVSEHDYPKDTIYGKDIALLAVSEKL